MSYKSNKIRKSARGEACTIVTPWCNSNTETTVLCHVNESFAGKGLGMKAHDFAAFYGCSDCHDIYDRRRPANKEFYDNEYFYVLRAVVRTLDRLFEKGVICER